MNQGADEHTIISQRVQSQTELIIEEVPDTPMGTSFSITRNDSGGPRLWTFAGTRANRITAKQIQSLVEVRRLEAVGLDLKTSIEPGSFSADHLTSDIVYSDDGIRQLAKPVKFGECLHQETLWQVVRLMQFADLLNLGANELP